MLHAAVLFSCRSDVDYARIVDAAFSLWSGRRRLHHVLTLPAAAAAATAVPLGWLCRQRDLAPLLPLAYQHNPLEPKYRTCYAKFIVKPHWLLTEEITFINFVHPSSALQ